MNTIISELNVLMDNSRATSTSETLLQNNHFQQDINRAMGFNEDIEGKSELLSFFNE